MGPQISTNRDIFPEKWDASARKTTPQLRPTKALRAGHQAPSTEVMGDETIQAHEVETSDSDLIQKSKVSRKIAFLEATNSFANVQGRYEWTDHWTLLSKKKGLQELTIFSLHTKHVFHLATFQTKPISVAFSHRVKFNATGGVWWLLHDPRGSGRCCGWRCKPIRQVKHSPKACPNERPKWDMDVQENDMARRIVWP